jgi:hypothetical protein
MSRSSPCACSTSQGSVITVAHRRLRVVTAVGPRSDAPALESGGPFRSNYGPNVVVATVE